MTPPLFDRGSPEEAKPQELPLPTLQSLMWPIGLFLGGLILTIVAWDSARQNAEQRFKQQFDSRTDQIISQLDGHLVNHQQVLQGFKGLYSASEYISRDEFRVYANSLGLLKDEMGFAAFAYHELVPESRLSPHIAKIRQQGISDYQIHPAGKRALYAPMVYIEPYQGANRAVLGFDPLTVEVERVAIERARDTGRLAVSGKLLLAQDAGEKLPSFVMYAPLYRNGAPIETLAQRRANFIGWIDVPYQVAKLIYHIIPEGFADIDFEIFDGDVVSEEALLFDSDGVWRTSAEFDRVHRYEIGGHVWTMGFYSLPGFGDRELKERPRLIATTGILLSLVLGLLALFAAQTQRHKISQELRKAEAENQEAREVLRKENERILRDGEHAARLAMESANDALERLRHQKFALDQHSIVATTDVQGRITYVNDKFCEVSGYKREELIGQDHKLLNCGMQPKGFFKEMYHQIANGKVWHGEVCNCAKDGHLYWVATTVVPFIGPDGKPEQYIAIRTDISRRKGIEAKIAESERDLQEAQRIGHFGSYITDIKTGLWEGSPNIDEVFGIDSTFEKTIPNWNSLVVPEHQQELLDYYYEVISTDGKFKHEYQIIRPRDGERRWIAALGEFTFDEEGEPAFLKGTVQDITERKEAELKLEDYREHLEEMVEMQTVNLRRTMEELQNSVEAASAASRAKSEFLANMSHEIRTPLNGVIGMVDIMQQSSLSPEQRRMLKTISDSSVALLNILNDILDYSKIEAGKMTVESVPTPLRDLAEGVVHLVTTVATNKGIDLYVCVCPALPDWVSLDATRLRQILLNLLGNAVKFTSSRAGEIGRVALRVEPCTLADEGPGIQLQVIDNGIGMSEDVVAKLFQPFTQADAGTARKFGGTGLGLSITQRLVSLMGGAISVSSTLGQGSEFVVKLPLVIAEPTHPLPKLPTLDGVQVVAVMRDPLSAEIVTSYLTSSGAKVTVLQDVRETQLLLARSPKTDTVLLLGLSVKEPVKAPEGIGILRCVRHGQTCAPHEIPVPSRPLNHDDLIRGVAQACGRIAPPAPAEILSASSPQEVMVPTVSQAQKQGQLILLAEDNEINRDVMLEQLSLLGYIAESAVDGVAAYAMWQTGRYSLLLTDCHMPNMDGFELTERIRQTEEGHLPIIAVTANAMQGEMENCLARGMDDFLSKPLRLTELKAMLAKWLPHVIETVTEPMTPVTETPSVGAPVWDISILASLVGNNPAMHRRLLEKFLPNAQQHVAEIAAAMDQGQIDKVAEVAHKLKSASRMVGAMQLGELCQTLEASGRAAAVADCKSQVAQLGAASEAVAKRIQHHLATPS